MGVVVRLSIAQCTIIVNAADDDDQDIFVYVCLLKMHIFLELEVTKMWEFK